MARIIRHMKRAWLTLVAAIAVSGGASCGGSDPSPLSIVVGKWYAQVGSCITEYNFSADGTFAYAPSVCVLSNGTVGAQEEVGNYTVSAGQIDFTTVQSTCHDSSIDPHRVPWAVYYARSGSSLILMYTNATIVLQPNTATGTAVVSLGCYATDGTFSPSTIGPP
jgi:hypothetical protein